MRWSKSAILTLIGADDDYTPASLVEEREVPAINQHGGNSSVIVYENSHHSFDSIDPVIHVPNAIAVGRRHTVCRKRWFSLS